MKNRIRILFALFILYVGFFAIKKEFGGNELGLFYQLKFIPFALLIILTIATFLLDFSFYKADKLRRHFATSFLGFLLCSIIFFKIFERLSIDKLKTVFQVSNKAGSENVLTFDFKENGKFTLTEFDLLGQTVFYGKYSNKKDTLLLIENNYDGKIKNMPKIGYIKNDTVYWKQFDTMIVFKQ